MAVAHVWTSRTLDAEELADLYEWLDRVPLSKPRSNVEKDFSDGILAAEIVRFYYPDLVDFRMLRQTLNLQERTDQWKLLNSEIFDKIGLTVPSHVLTQLSISKSGIAQAFLFNLRMSLALTGAQTQLFPPPHFMYDPRLNGASYPVHGQAQSYLFNPYQANAKNMALPYLYPPPFVNNGMKPGDYEAAMAKAAKSFNANTPNLSPGRSPTLGGKGKMDSPSQKSLVSQNGKGKGGKNEPFVPLPAVNASVSISQTKSELYEKTKKLEDKEAEVNELKAQMKRMEEMVKAKNSKIQELTSQVEKMKGSKDSSTRGKDSPIGKAKDSPTKPR